MKRHSIILSLFMALCICANSQSITVTKRYEVPNGSGGNKFFPVLNPEGNKLLYTSDSYHGLTLYDFQKQTTTTVSAEPGAGYEPIFGNDETRVFYRTTSFRNGRRFDGMEGYDIAKKQKTVMLSPQRDLRQPRNFHNGFIVSSDKKLLKSTFGRTTKALSVYVTSQDLKIYLYRNDKFQVLNPLDQPDTRYLWVSLSPDSKKILFTAAGKGAYVCDLDGKIIATLGYLNAPVWYDDNYVVGMQDKDDGHKVISSQVTMVSLSGKVKSQLSLPDEIAMYPTASGKAARIAYNTLDGKIKIVDIGIK